MSGEHGELPADVRGLAVRAIRIGLRNADELLEVRLAFHAHVLVDRHRTGSVVDPPAGTEGPPRTLRSPCPVSATELERDENRKRSCDRLRPRRLGRLRSARRARRRAARGPSGARPALRPGRGDPRGGSGPRAWAVDRAHERRNSAVRARPAYAALQRPPAADFHARARARATRRGLGRRHRRVRRSARTRLRARHDPWPEAFRARRRRPVSLPRRGRVRRQVHGDPPRRRRGPDDRRRRAAGGARAAHATHDGERLRADRPLHPGRPRDDRTTPGCDRRAHAGARRLYRELAEATEAMLVR